MELSGDANELVALLFDELRGIAASHLRHQRKGHTLQATELVNEAYVRIVRDQNLNIANREEFLRLASHVMRNLLVDHARNRNAAKRGGAWQRITLSGISEDQNFRQVDVLALDEALTKLAAFDERVAQLVELRFFGGLTEEESAAVLDVSRAAVSRDWRLARSLLAHMLEDNEPEL